MKKDKKTLSTLEFGKDAADYDSSRRYSSLRDSYPRIVEEAVAQPFTAMADIGCGTGALLMMIHDRRKNARLFGIDISEEMIKVAKAKLGAKAELRVSDSENLPFKDGSIGLVTCTFSFHHHPNASAVFKEFHRILAPQGRLIMADPLAPFPLRNIMNVFVPFSKDGTVRYYSRPEMAALAESAGLSMTTWAKLNWHSYLMVATRKH